MKIIALGASNSKASINKVFASYVAHQIAASEIEVLDLNQYDLPLYSIDQENGIGIPQLAYDFLRKIESADLLVVSLAEHNGSYTTAFKNLFDWTSRLKLKMFEAKKMVLLSTSPGARGGKGVLEAALARFPIHGANIIMHFSLPKFEDNFKYEQGILNPELRAEFEAKLRVLDFHLV